MHQRFLCFLFLFLLLPTSLLAANIGISPFGWSTALDSPQQQNGPSVAIGDLNNDGLPDLAVAQYDGVFKLIGNGDGTFQSPVSLAAEPGYTSIVIGDVNVDGWPDLAVARYNGVSILLGTGDGTFLQPVSFIAGVSINSIAIGDIDADGFPDLAISDYSCDPYLYVDAITILLGNGDGTFRSPVSFQPGGSMSIAIGDVNRDGQPDLLYATVMYDLYLRYGNGDGTFQPAVPAGIPSVYSVAIGDLNNDGWSDLVVGSYDDETYYSGYSIRRNNGDGTFSIVDEQYLHFDFRFAIGDLDGDAQPDLVGGRYSLWSFESSVSTWRNETLLPVWTTTYPRVGTVGVDAAEVLANADGDGAAYLVCLPNDSTPPTSVQVRAGQNATGTALEANFADSATLTANSTASLACTSLAPIVYDLYVVAADSEGSLQSIPTKLVASTDPSQHIVSTLVDGGNGTLSCDSPISTGNTSLCTATPASNQYVVSTISGCGAGTQNGNVYTTGPITTDCTVTATFVQKVPVEVLSPAGGVLLPESTPALISWTQTPAAVYSYIRFSSDGGTSWTFLKKTTNQNSYLWTTPSVSDDLTNCLIKVTVHDAADHYLSQQITPVFTIENSIVPVTVTSPDGGEILEAGNVATIQWSPATNAAKYEIFYSLNGGSSWQYINQTATTSWNWSPPFVLSDEADCLVKVKAFDAANAFLNEDNSNGTFTVRSVGVPIQVLSPNGGETLISGTVVAVQWSAISSAQIFHVRYSLDNGATWVYTKKVVGATNFTWTVPSVTGVASSCLLKVTAHNSNDQYIAQDISDATFVISQY